MNTIQYVGENLLPGQIGHFAILLAFVAAALAAVSYFFATQNRTNNSEYEQWRNLGRVAFGLHGLGVFTTIATIFYVMIYQLYEYHYAFQHVSDDLPMQYIASAFWEGQEGSFLLWMFWHVVLGGVLMFTAKQWESPVLSVIAVVEVFLMTMILGLYFGADDVKVGSNPLVLLRDAMDAPIFSDPNYLSQIQGTGLNPLLQNYWMTIHPPTLFLGFASTVVPFAFAIAGLWTQDHKGWLRPTLPWAAFSAFILGLGILMGGAWAYEALSFGGYWAWDPVENMSLVPWLVLVAGVHTVLIARNTGHSIKASYLFLIFSFALVVYSTFLTRSGILGDSSVHAFTEMGLEWQLTIFLLATTLGGLSLLGFRWKTIIENPKEETAYSREFWMFIGSLVLIFSSILITFTTSVPVYNKISNVLDGWFPSVNLALNWSSPKEPVAHYNKYQIWIAVLIGLLSGFAQFLRYKAPSSNYVKKIGLRLGVHAGVAAVLTGIFTQILSLNTVPYLILAWTSLFAILVNGDYLVSVLRGKIKVAGSAVAHIGFGIMIIGILFSGLNKQVISKDAFMRTNLIEGFSEGDENNNILLYKNLPTQMNDYLVTYLSDSINGLNRYFVVNYKRLDKNKNVIEEFDLVPNIIYDKNESKIAASNPSTKHYLHRDIFTHISALPRVELEPEFARAVEDSLKYQEYELQTGDIAEFSKTKVEFLGFNRNPQTPNYTPQGGDIAVGARLKITTKNGDSTRFAEPVFLIRENGQFGIAAELGELGLKIKFSDRFPEIIAETETNLTAKEFEIQQGAVFEVGGYTVAFSGFNKKPQNPSYLAQKGDIAVSAILEISKDNQTQATAEPVFIIRDNAQYNVPSEVRALGLRFRFLSIDPNTGKMKLEAATGLPTKEKVILEIAENVGRNDYIVMEAIVFPAINLFWLGSLMMLFGFLMSLSQRIKG